MRTATLIRTVGLAVAFLAASSAAAHHGFTGRYDSSRPLWIEGEVTNAYFGQPHPEVTIRTSGTMNAPTRQEGLPGLADMIGNRVLEVRADTRGQEVRIEFPPVGSFFGLGRIVSVGDRVAVIAYRNCNAPNQLRGQWIIPKTGAPVAYAGQAQQEVEGC